MIRSHPGGPSADRRAFVAALTAGLLLAPRRGRAQGPPRVWRIGLLTPSSITARGPLSEMRARLRQMGYVEGRDVRYEIRAANEDYERLPDLAADLVRAGVDLIVAVTPPAIRAAENATSTIPIVMLGGTDPVASLFVASLARPGGNVTGVSTHVPELAARRVEVLRECVPGLRRVGILANFRNPTSATEARALDVAARAMALEVQVADARLPEQYPDAFAAFARGGAGTVFVTADPVISTNRDRIISLAVRHRLPAMYEWREIVEAGGLMSYGPSLAEVHGRLAVFVDRIIKGADPRELPVERPTRFELAVNLKTAGAMGLIIPPAVLARAERVVR